MKKTYILASALAFICMPLMTAAAQLTVVLDNTPNPHSITVQAGDTVVWQNKNSDSYTVEAVDGTWNSGMIAPGGQYAHTFSNAGPVAYIVGLGQMCTGGCQVPTVTGGQTPLPAPSQSISALQAQIQTLIQVLSKLKTGQATGVTAPTQAPASTASPVACLSLTRTLSPGSFGVDVSALQQFLAHDPSIYPEAKVTGYYGSLTLLAVQRFQTKYGIINSGSLSTTGYGRVGPQTLAEINRQCANGAVGAFMQVSPQSGSAPLGVSAQVTINTTNSCQAANYTLDWGDQSQSIAISVPAGTCQPLQQTYTHTFQQTGNYGIVLSSGAHSSQAVVSVGNSSSSGAQ